MKELVDGAGVRPEPEELFPELKPLLSGLGGDGCNNICDFDVPRYTRCFSLSTVPDRTSRRFRARASIYGMDSNCTSMDSGKCRPPSGPSISDQKTILGGLTYQ